MDPTLAEPPPDAAMTGDPLSLAVSARDRDVIDMVKTAVARGQTLLAFQPVVTCAAGTVAFHEGLIRVQDRTGRIIPARQFIHVIESLELGRAVDCAALGHGLDALAEDPGLRLSINMSARSIGYGPWRRVLDSHLSRDPLLAERLILEITESSAMRVPELVIRFMEDLQPAGVAFALDDFGAGYTAFRYLRDFLFDVLKIDAQFTRNVHADPDNQVLLEALLSIGRHFDMLTVAEGVETGEELAFLKAAGFDCVQGYLTGVPRTLSPLRQRESQGRRA